MSDDIILFGHENSGHAYKVALALTLAQIPYRYEWVDINASPQSRPQAFLDASRWAEVPCLLRNHQSMIQSGAILLMLAREYDVLGGKPHLDHAAEWINWEANRIGMCVPQLLWAERFPEDVPEGARNWLRGRYEIDHQRLSDQLREREFLLGDMVTIADIAVYGYVSKVDPHKLPLSETVIGWRERIAALPHFQNAQDLLSQGKR